MYEEGNLCLRKVRLKYLMNTELLACVPSVTIELD